MLMSRSQWDVRVERGGGARKNMPDWQRKWRSKAAVRLNNAEQERARRALLEQKSSSTSARSRRILERDVQGACNGRDHVYRLVESFISDYSSAEVHVDGLKAKVSIPPGKHSQNGLKEYGRYLTGALGYEMVLLHGGKFQMGSPVSEVGRDLDEHQHTVTLSRDFYIGREVTQSLWRQVMFDSPSHFKSCEIIVPSIRCLGAMQSFFSNRLSLREGYEPVYQIPDNY